MEKPSWIVVRSCPLCGLSLDHKLRFDPFDMVSSYEQIFYSKCQRCGMVFQNPRMNQPMLDKLYERDYRKMVHGSEGDASKASLTEARRANRTATEFCEWRDTTNPGVMAREGDTVILRRRALDIGSSTGALVVGWDMIAGYDAVGVEPYTEYRVKSQQALGVEVADRLEYYEGEEFHLISMIHVLEHLPNPVEYLRNLRDHYSRSDAWLVIEVPNLYGHKLPLGIFHPMAFSQHTLQQTLQKGGWEVKHMRTFNTKHQIDLPIKWNIIAYSQPGPIVERVKPERFVRLRRLISQEINQWSYIRQAREFYAKTYSEDPSSTAGGLEMVSET